MSSKDKIIAALQHCNLPDVPLPAATSFEENTENLLESFSQTLTGIGGDPVRVSNFESINHHLLELCSRGLLVVNSISEISNYNVYEYSDRDPGDLEQVDTFFVKGRLGVAENGAIWVTEGALVNRLFPFIAHNLVLVIYEKDIVSNLHRAYERLVIDEEGYGVFIAGPSKTADIEQSLVIGAHGPLSLKVFIIQS